jgi:hypothetical protein
VKTNELAVSVEHRGAKVVIENATAGSPESRKSPHMASKEVLEFLVEEELQVQGTRIGKNHDEAAQPSDGPTDGDRAEVSPIDLSFLCWKASQL